MEILVMSDCICKGNWRKIIEKSEPMLDSLFTDGDGAVHRFIGVMYSSDDYYYCMMSMAGELRRLTCVGSIESFGFDIINT